LPRYRDREDLMDRLRDHVIGPAQAKARELEARLREVERAATVPSRAAPWKAAGGPGWSPLSGA
jgi:hypothetical protein